MFKDALKRGLIISLVIVLIACVGGIGLLDLTGILFIFLLCCVLGIVSYIAHNRKDGDGQ